MTLPVQVPQIEYAEDGVSTSFPVPFRYRDPGHVRAERVAADNTVTALVAGADFALTAGDTEGGGTLTVTTPAASGVSLVIWRETPLRSEGDYETTGAFTAQTHEDLLDEAAMRDQDQQTVIERAVKTPRGEDGYELPFPRQRTGGLVFGFDAQTGAPALIQLDAAVLGGDIYGARKARDDAAGYAAASKADREATAALLASVSADALAVSQTLGQIEAASLARAAYPNAAATYVPKGVLALAIASAGSGGTNGTFALGWSGGDFDVDPGGTFTVSGGAVTAVTLTGPGYALAASPAAPSPVFTASSGLTGAALTVTVGDLHGEGEGYWVASADNETIKRYVNDGGSPLAVSAAIEVPQASKLAALTAQYDSIVGQFEDASQIQLFDADAAGAQYGYLLNTGTGLAADTADHLGYGIPQKSRPLEPSTTYTLSIFGAPTEWGIQTYASAAVHLYNAAGTHYAPIALASVTTHAGSSGAGTALVRALTFTTPAGFPSGGHMKFIVRAPGYDEASFDRLCASVMLSQSASPVEFEPYYADDTKLLPAAAEAPKAMWYEWQGLDLYWRGDLAGASDRDLVHRLRIDPVAATAAIVNPHEGVDFAGQFHIAAATAYGNTIAAFHRSDATRISIGGDEWTPQRFDNRYYSRGHGALGYLRLGSHSKTNEDIGSIYQVTAGGTPYQYVLSAILEDLYIGAHSTALVDGLLFVPVDDDKEFSRAGLYLADTPTLSHVSGGTNTGGVAYERPAAEGANSATPTATNATFATDLRPVERDYERSVFVDGEAVAVGDSGHCDRFRIRESFDILSASDQQDYLVANAGNASAPDYDNAGVDGVLRVSLVHTFNAAGFIETIGTIEALTEFDLGVSDYLNLQQIVRMGENSLGTDRLFLRAPGHATYDTAQEITANAAPIYLLDADYDDPDEPTRWFTQVLTNAAGVNQHSNYIGLDLEDDAILAQSDRRGFCSGANKLYMHAVNSLGATSRTIAAGTVLQWSQCRGPSLCFDSKVDGLWLPHHGGRQYCVIAVNAAVNNLWCPLPEWLIGRTIRELDGAKGGDGAVMLNTARQVAGAGINISSSGAGWVAVELQR
jgi:hypothetical protein|tara:strand:- start:4712 stop:7963 length:3252 start_codon:yes stop_codon:yes gene_type:complete